MVKQVVTAADSKFGAGTFYELTDTVASSFTLEAGAFLNSTTADSIKLEGTASWTTVINGHSSGGDEGLWDESSGNSKITIGEDGSLRATTSVSYGALLLGFGGSNTVINNGMIFGEQGSGILSNDNLVLTNSGLIAGGNSVSLGLNSTIVALATTHTVTNTGTLLGDILFSNGNNKLVNSGLISNDTEYGAGLTHSNVLFGTGDDTFDNKGVIDGYVDLGGGLNKGTNAKSITGKDGNDVTVLAGSGNDTFTNAKGATLAGGVNLGNGMNVFTNAGAVGEDNTGASYTGSNDLLAIDTVKNSGTLDGDVYLFAGNDVFTNTGQVLGTIDLGDGNDVFKGGNFAETVEDYAGTDKIGLGGGNDTFIAYGGEGDGKDGLMGNPAPDDVDGGTGIDTYDGSQVAQAGGTGIRVNLDSVVQEGIAKSTAKDGSGVYIDTLKGFENVTGSSFEDVIYGSSAVNVLSGGIGNDYLYGLAGNDVIDGGDNGDRVAGGLGADILRGGNGFDTFYYMDIKDSGLTKATRDVIEDYNEANDFIDLNLIDADTRASATGDQAFTSIITSGGFTVGTAQALRIYQTATGWMIEGEVNGDAKADFSIAVNDFDHSIGWAFGSQIIE